MQHFWQQERLKKGSIKTVQINLGNRCNLHCAHCHIEASPQGRNMMDRETAQCVMSKIKTLPQVSVELTGGAPEMNENLPLFIEGLSELGIKPTVRTNLVILLEEPFKRYIDLYARHGVRLIGSLPSADEVITDTQRGHSVFKGAIKALRLLNERGYGYDDNLRLDLVSNPSGDYLHRSQTDKEREFKDALSIRHGVVFNSLFALTNSPIGRFKEQLHKKQALEAYMRILMNNFNYETVKDLMCRSLISVDYKGNVFDCDFNLALGIEIEGYKGKRFWEIDLLDFNPPITCKEHCYACVASCGSSCHGALTEDVKDVVKHYYGKVLSSKADLKTSACCSIDDHPKHIRDTLRLIAEEVQQRHYGCGSPIPLHLKGLSVLDIGSGTGRDCYILSRLVGEDGFVYGIDMTASQVEIAKRYQEYHRNVFGYSRSNAVFIHDYLENVAVHFMPSSLDLVISNCVVNLVEDKERLLRDVYSLLKEGGELYFSDIYVDRRLPEDVRKDPLLYAECLGGALYLRDFERMARRVGFNDVRAVSKRQVQMSNPEIEQKVGNAVFYSITYRLFKIQALEDACEDYGHIAIYKGGIEEAESRFLLDECHVFEKGRPERVCGNTALILSRTRFKDHFEIIGDFKTHHGAFTPCGGPTGLAIKQGGSCC